MIWGIPILGTSFIVLMRASAFGGPVSFVYFRVDFIAHKGSNTCLSTRWIRLGDDLSFANGNFGKTREYVLAETSQVLAPTSPRTLSAILLCHK